MNRRHLMAALAAAAALPAVAYAQSGATTGGMGSGTSPSGAGAAQGGAMQMGEAEMRHAQQTLAAGTVAHELARQGMEKGRNPWVKKFATYEANEQETVADVLKPFNVTPAPMDEKQQAMIKKFNGMQPGANFDREFVEAQIDGHQELLKLQENYLANGKDLTHVTMAKLARNQIREHIDLLQTIQKELKG